MKIFNLIITLDKIKGEENMVVSYRIREDVTSPEEALRAAVQDFINSGTQESIKALEYAGGCFNWGDAMSSIPNEYFIKRGLTPIEGDSIDISVDHDEILDNRKFDEEDENEK